MRANEMHVPIAEDRTTVGKSSEPYRYMTQNEMTTKNRTAMDSGTITQATNKETQGKKRVFNGALVCSPRLPTKRHVERSVCLMVHLFVHPGCQQRDTRKETCV